MRLRDCSSKILWGEERQSEPTAQGLEMGDWEICRREAKRSDLPKSITLPHRIAQHLHRHVIVKVVEG